jgi:catechol 2,3-dioxygenase-like lactoylglutathione lyase family enzyme
VNDEGGLVEHVTINVAGTPGVRDFYRRILGELGAAETVDAQGRAAFGGSGDFGLYDRTSAFFHATHNAVELAQRAARRARRAPADALH